MDILNIIQHFLTSMLPNITNSDSSSEENDEFIDNISESTNPETDNSSTNSMMYILNIIQQFLTSMLPNITNSDDDDDKNQELFPIIF